MFSCRVLFTVVGFPKEKMFLCPIPNRYSQGLCSLQLKSSASKSGDTGYFEARFVQYKFSKLNIFISSNILLSESASFNHLGFGAT